MDYDKIGYDEVAFNDFMREADACRSMIKGKFEKLLEYEPKIKECWPNSNTGDNYVKGFNNNVTAAIEEVESVFTQMLNNFQNVFDDWVRFNNQ